MISRHRIPSLLMTLVVLLSCAISFAMLVIHPKGAWPDTWPKELERYRDNAKSIDVAHGIHEWVHEIQFSERSEFEKAWPHILNLKSKGAPLILEKNPSYYPNSGSKMSAGVRILCPSGPGYMERPDGTHLNLGPPWPESILSPRGTLPECAVPRNGNWIPWDGKKLRGFIFRARVDIMLIADGEIVDLNRISLPPDTPVIDRRFEDQSKPANAK